jgi:hypothetical protein
MRELSVELFHYGYPLESIQRLLTAFGSLTLEKVPESFEMLHTELLVAVEKDRIANPRGLAACVARRSDWELLVATPANVLILVSLLRVEFRFGRDSSTLSRQLIEIARECGCPTKGDGVSV